MRGAPLAALMDPDFSEEVERRIAEIRALDGEESKADDLDDRIGIRRRRNELERRLGHRLVERTIATALAATPTASEGASDPR